MIGKLSVLSMLLMLAAAGCTNGQPSVESADPSDPTPVSPPDAEFVTPTIDFEVDPENVQQDDLDYTIDDQSLLALLDDFLTVRSIPLDSPPVSYQNMATLVGDFDTRIVNCAVQGVINITGYIREAGAISSGDLHGYEIGECVEKRGTALSGSYFQRFLADAELDRSGSQPVIRRMLADITYDRYSTAHAEPSRQVVLTGTIQVEQQPIEYPRRGLFDEQLITSEQLRVDFSAADLQGHYLLQDLVDSEYFDEALDAPTLAYSALVYSSNLEGSYYIHGADVNDGTPWFSRFILMGKDNSTVIINIDAMNNVRYALDSDGDGEIESQATYSALNYLDLGAANTPIF